MAMMQVCSFISGWALQVRKQAMSLLLLGLLNDVGPGKCHTGSFDGQIARSCYEECGQLGLKLGWVFLNEFDEEHGIGGSTTEDRVVEKNGTNFKTPHESGSVDSVTTSFPDLRTTAIASSTPVLSEEQDMAQLLPKCMEEDLKVCPRCQTCWMPVIAICCVCLCCALPGIQWMLAGGNAPKRQLVCSIPQDSPGEVGALPEAVAKCLATA